MSVLQTWPLLSIFKNEKRFKNRQLWTYKNLTLKPIQLPFEIFLIIFIWLSNRVHKTCKSLLAKLIFRLISHFIIVYKLLLTNKGGFKKHKKETETFFKLRFCSKRKQTFPLSWAIKQIIKILQNQNKGCFHEWYVGWIIFLRELKISSLLF